MFDTAATSLTVQEDMFASRLLAAIGSAPVVASPVTSPAPPAAVPAHFVIPASVQLGAGGPKAKFAANVDAIRVLRAVESDARDATAAERVTMVQYVGWGGLPHAFRNPDTGSVARGWESEVDQLEALLSADELADARRSTQDSHYTPRVVVEAIHSGLARLGFNGGVVLDPAFGTGHFLGMAPLASRQCSNWTAVELDGLTSSIAAALYPEARLIRSTALQDVNLAQGHFDAAIGNPPFGATVPYDPSHPDLAGFTLHNFFFAKAVKCLRPGGLLAMVVTHRLMDRPRSKERKWLAARTELLGAIRLPRTTFRANAGTDVTTDIVFLRKLEAGESTPFEWSALDAVASDTDGDSIPVNAYFAANPHMMLGHMTSITSRYGSVETALMPRADEDLAAALASALTHLPTARYAPRPANMDHSSEIHVPANVAVFGHFVGRDGTIYQRERDLNDCPRAVPVDVTGRDRDRLLSHMVLRDLLRDLLASEQDDAASDESLLPMRSALNAAYDAHVRSFGYLNSLANTACFRDDADSFRVRALEKGYQRLTAAEAALKGIAVKGGRKTVAYSGDIDH